MPGKPRSRFDIKSIVRALNGRRSSNGTWMCRCPTHRDKSPSLAVKDANGHLLLYCHAGCTYENVMSELVARGLVTIERDTAVKPAKDLDTFLMERYPEIWRTGYLDGRNERLAAMDLVGLPQARFDAYWSGKMLGASIATLMAGLPIEPQDDQPFRKNSPTEAQRRARSRGKHTAR
jgi:hypothetical protein